MEELIVDIRLIDEPIDGTGSVTSNTDLIKSSEYSSDTSENELTKTDRLKWGTQVLDDTRHLTDSKVVKPLLLMREVLIGTAMKNQALTG